MRWAVTITGYRKKPGSIENFISQSVQSAENEVDAVKKACKTEGVVDKLIEGYKLFWQKACEINDKVILRESFEAGKAFSNECHCGKCDYCLDIKGEDAPDFETWYKNQYK